MAMRGVFLCLVASAMVAADPAIHKTLSDVGEKMIEKYMPSSKVPLQRRDGHTADTPPVLASKYGGTPGFYHGVASGSPAPDAVIIWTRWTPADADEMVEIQYRMVAVDSTFDFGDLSDGQPHAMLSDASAMAGSVMVNISTDWTVKLDIKGLSAKTTYLFGFQGPDGVSSRTGMTKTAPAVDDATVEELNYAVFSCAKWDEGYFHAYKIASELEQLDFWLHVGDYIYEESVELKPESVREGEQNVLDPPNELVSRNDYRTRYAQYHTDEALQALRARAPVIAMWDDHELVDNSYAGGSPLHNETTEGSFALRATVAAQTYLEWMPLRVGTVFDDTGVIMDIDITQVVEWGQLATLAVLESRVKARTAVVADPVPTLVYTGLTLHTDANQYDEAPANATFAAIAAQNKAARTSDGNKMIGDDQLQLLEDTFKASKAAGKPWQLMTTGNVFGKIVFGDPFVIPTLVPTELAGTANAVVQALLSNPVSQGIMRAFVAGSQNNIPINVDAWDGYSAERAKVLAIFKDHANNAVVYSGDSHDSWAFALFENEEEQSGDPVGINIAVPSVSAPGFGPVSPPLHTLGFGAAGWSVQHGMWRTSNPSMKYVNIKDKGFVKVKVTMTEHVADYIYATDDLASVQGNYETFLTQPYDEFADGVAPSSCGVRLVTTAGQLGSLDRPPCSPPAQPTSPPATTQPETTPAPVKLRATMTLGGMTKALFTEAAQTTFIAEVAKLLDGKDASDITITDTREVTLRRRLLAAALEVDYEVGGFDSAEDVSEAASMVASKTSDLVTALKADAAFSELSEISNDFGDLVITTPAPLDIDNGASRRFFSCLAWVPLAAPLFFGAR